MEILKSDNKVTTNIVIVTVIVIFFIKSSNMYFQEHRILSNVRSTLLADYSLCRKTNSKKANS